MCKVKILNRTREIKISAKDILFNQPIFFPKKFLYIELGIHGNLQKKVYDYVCDNNPKSMSEVAKALSSNVYGEQNVYRVLRDLVKKGTLGFGKYVDKKNRVCKKPYAIKFIPTIIEVYDGED